MPLVPVCLASELPPGARRIVAHGKVTVGVFNVGGVWHAYRNVCPHAGAPVCEGPVSGTTLPSRVYEYNTGREGSILRCPWHGWEFDLTNGEHLVDPETRLKKIPVELASVCDAPESPGAPDPARPCPSPSALSPGSPDQNLVEFPVELAEGRLFVRLP
ncbi:MAG: Rieske (2Fe-2S) protein [Burkholderiales bacterium]|nr:Rieske (2Fe-2S) protein [Opitutaceae bacterium]